MQARLCAFVAFWLLFHGPSLAAGAAYEDILSLVQIGLKKVELGRGSGLKPGEWQELSSSVRSDALHQEVQPRSRQFSSIWDLMSKTLAGVDRASAPSGPKERGRIIKAAKAPMEFVSVQTKEVQDERPLLGSFLSTDGHFCAEGLLQNAKGALAHRKASVQGSLYKKSQVANQTCADRGFNLKGGTDSCFPGLKTYFREREDHAAFLDEESMALSAFQAKYKLSLRQAGLMAACMCHPDSTALSLIGHHCEGLEGFHGAWVHRNPETKEELMCSEGLLSLPALGLAAVSEPTAELLMQGRDTVSPTSCAHLGFPVQLVAADKCLPGLSMWTKKHSAVDQGLAKLSMMQDRLVTPSSKVASADGPVACALRATKAPS